ncbi:hypothetical protein LSH36_316g03038 [Paralvinella palmiformis]|uniref:U3 small nucleolar RNA-associated protein 15 C-terminal domain-containing protein n=1 Tax=Paralvinella palmiformis TaxID=53620 RepID=A0AAD9JI47_9ANNE|nr:hypothetical protein LSH36_316g03038 [Paralvinella palmiformis]
MSDGLLSVQKRRDEEEIEKEKFQRSKEKKGDEIVKHQHRQKLEKYDKYLKRFEHSKALDAAMDIRVRTRTPEVTISVIQELIRRNRIKPALAGRDNKSLVAVLTFLQKESLSVMQGVLFSCCTKVDKKLLPLKKIKVSPPKCNLRMPPGGCKTSKNCLDLYWDEFGHSTIVDEAMLKLKTSLEMEVNYVENCMQIMGMIETLLTSADVMTTDIHQGSIYQGSLPNDKRESLAVAGDGDK